MAKRLLHFVLYVAVSLACVYLILVLGLAHYVTDYIVPALRSLRPIAEPVVVIVLRVFMLPGIFFLLVPVPQDSWQFTLLGLFDALFSWLVWRVVISRTLFALGRWDPFEPKSGRPALLRAYVRLREWSVIHQKFGQESTGGWADLIDVLSCRWMPGDIFLGRPKLKIGGLLRPVGIPSEKHFVTFGETGSGKSTGSLIPNLCLHGNAESGSLLCIDPKGELARITAARRGDGGDDGVQGLGQKVCVLDPFRITGLPCASYNVFDEMERIAARDPDGPVGYANKVAEALVAITGRDPYWDTAARRIVAGLMLYVLAGPKEKRNLVQVRRLLMEGDPEAFRRGVAAKTIDPKRNSPFDALLIGMKNVPAGPYRDTIAFAAASLLEMGPNQLGSVLSTAQEHTAFLDVPEIRSVCLKSDFLLEDLKNSAVSVYLCVPLNAMTGVAGRWLRMFVLLLIDMMMRVAAAPKIPILLAIDEFPSLGKLEGIEVVAPVLRSYGVRFHACGQNIEQFRAVYPDSWGGFIGGAEAVQFMGSKHPETVKMVTELLATHTVKKRVGNFVNETDRNLLDPDQVSRILHKSQKNQIVWYGDRPPMLLKLTPYYEYLPPWYYSPDPRFPEKWNRAFWRGGLIGVRGQKAPQPRPPAALPAFVAPDPARPTLPPAASVPALLSAPKAEPAVPEDMSVEAQKARLRASNPLALPHQFLDIEFKAILAARVSPPEKPDGDAPPVSYMSAEEQKRLLSAYPQANDDDVGANDLMAAFGNFGKVRRTIEADEPADEPLDFGAADPKPLHGPWLPPSWRERAADGWARFMDRSGTATRRIRRELRWCLEMLRNRK